MEDEKHREYHLSDGVTYCNGDFSIEFSLNEDPNLLYFKVFRKYYGGECCRISMVEPKFLDSDFIISKAELNDIINIFNSKSDNNRTYWEKLIDDINWERSFDSEYYQKIDKLPMPDYKILEGECV